VIRIKKLAGHSFEVLPTIKIINFEEEVLLIELIVDRNLHQPTQNPEVHQTVATGGQT
jgi:hypothetical protein